MLEGKVIEIAAPHRLVILFSPDPCLHLLLLFIFFRGRIPGRTKFVLIPRLCGFRLSDPLCRYVTARSRRLSRFHSIARLGKTGVRQRLPRPRPLHRRGDFMHCSYALRPAPTPLRIGAPVVGSAHRLRLEESQPFALVFNRSYIPPLICRLTLSLDTISPCSCPNPALLLPSPLPKPSA